MQATVLQARLVNANPNAAIVGEAPLPSVSNYLIGTDQSKWRTNVKQYSRVRYTGIYPGVDLVYYGNQHDLEYDFVIAPGADSKDIRLSYSGAEQLSLNAQGDLVISTATGELVQHKPVIYQTIDGKRQNVAGGFVLGKQHDVGFEIASYDSSRPLTVDPQMAYSTFIGGTGNDSVVAIAVDQAGNAYITGSASSSNFPTTSGAIKTAKGANPTIFVAKLNTSGSSLNYSTFLGGNNGVYSDVSTAIAVDASGNAYVTGDAYTSDFPVTAGALQTSKRSSSASPFIAKLNATGSALIYSTYLSGSNATFLTGDRANAIAVAADGTAYVAGSRGTTDFPVTSSAFQKTNGSAFISRLNATGSALLYSTYLGGSGGDTINGIAVDASGNAYVTGSTASKNFPVTAGAAQSVYGGASESNVYGDAFVTKINPAGSALLYSTYLGGSGDDSAAGIAVDSAGNAYVTGSTASINFPVTSGALQPVHLRSPYVATSTAYVTKLNSTGHAFIYSTYLGGTSSETGSAIAVDSAGNAYAVGTTSSTDFPTTAGAPQTALAPPVDAFISKINPTGTALVYSSYLGGQTTNVPSGSRDAPPPTPGVDVGNAVAVDSCGSAYVAGYTNSSDFPITLGAAEIVIGNMVGAPLLYQDINNGFVTKIIASGTAGSVINLGTPPPYLTGVPPTRIGIVIGSALLGIKC